MIPTFAESNSAPTRRPVSLTLAGLAAMFTGCGAMCVGAPLLLSAGMTFLDEQKPMHDGSRPAKILFHVASSVKCQQST